MLMEKLYLGKRAVPLAHAVVKTTQREWDACKDHNHGQRDGVCSTWNHRKGIRNHGLLCTSILLLGKGRHRENMNGLVRQYIPKRTDLREISRGYVRKIVGKLNNRPRKKNGFSSPQTWLTTQLPNFALAYGIRPEGTSNRGSSKVCSIRGMQFVHGLKQEWRINLYPYGIRLCWEKDIASNVLMSS